MSTRTTRAPIRATASAVATNVLAGSTTSSPRPTPAARRASSTASVPLATPTQCWTPENAANSRSKPATSSPPTKAVFSMTRLKPVLTSSATSAWAARRSTSGIIWRYSICRDRGEQGSISDRGNPTAAGRPTASVGERSVRVAIGADPFRHRPSGRQATKWGIRPLGSDGYPAEPFSSRPCRTDWVSVPAAVTRWSRRTATGSCPFSRIPSIHVDTGWIKVSPSRRTKPGSVAAAGPVIADPGTSVQC